MDRVVSGADQQTEARTEFEVASIKPAAPGGRGMFMRNSPGGRVNVNNLTLKDMVLMAYRIQPFQISGRTCVVRFGAITIFPPRRRRRLRRVRFR